MRNKFFPAVFDLKRKIKDIELIRNRTTLNSYFLNFILQNLNK